MATFDLNILVVATGRYTSYALELIESISVYCEPELRVKVIIFTDRSSDFLYVPIQSPVLKIIEIDSYGWPEATLLRYQIFRDNWNAIDAPIVMYLDADTCIRAPLSQQLIDEYSQRDKVSVVAHPGYFNRWWPIRFALKTPFGPWERNKSSLAFAPLLERRNYVCGGVWFGGNLVIRDLCQELAENVDVDLKKGIIAKFHDESHLNKWKISNPERIRILTPMWAWAYGYRNLRRISPIIEVIHKPKDWKRE